MENSLGDLFYTCKKKILIYLTVSKRICDLHCKDGMFAVLKDRNLDHT